MQLPVLITSTPADERCVLVDGHGPAARLELSHWPGNRTPPALRHRLSTGCCLAFDRLPAAEREALTAGATALVNNHYDTDGVLALFALRHPEEALDRAGALLGAAAAGDFFRWPDDRSLAIDAIVLGLDRSPESPLAGEWPAKSDEARWTRCAHYLLEALPAMLDGDLAPWRALWHPVLEGARADRRELERCERIEDERRDLCTWIAPRNARADPGRHALFGSTDADRVLLISPGDEGTRVRLVLSTVSWFEPVRLERLARPDLDRLTERLNVLEGSAPQEAHAWRAQDSRGPSPELWFGTRTLAPFVERNDAAVPSGLDPERVRAEIERALEPPA